MKSKWCKAPLLVRGEDQVAKNAHDGPWPWEEAGIIEQLKNRDESLDCGRYLLITCTFMIFITQSKTARVKLFDMMLNGHQKSLWNTDQSRFKF